MGNQFHLISIIKGESSKKKTQIYAFFVFLIYIFGLVVAISTYPNFSFTNVYTSYLGAKIHNPDSYVFYNITVLVCGFFLIPIFVYLFKNLKKTSKFLRLLINLFGVIGCVGFGLIGVYHQGYNALGHQITTILAFGGFGTFAFFLLLLSIRSLIKKRIWPNLTQFLILFFFLFGFIIIGFLFGETSLLYNLDIDPKYGSDHFVEWIFVLGVFFWLMLLTIFLPESRNFEK